MITAQFAGSALAADRHAAAILLTDAATGAVVPLDYSKAISPLVRRGAIQAVRLRLPAGTRLPARIKAFVIADAFPLAEREL